MPANAPHPEAMVKVKPDGPKDRQGIQDLLDYISRDGDVDIKPCERWGGAGPIPVQDFPELARGWVEAAAQRPDLRRGDGSRKPIATHIIVSLPKVFGETQNGRNLAEEAMRAFARELFESGRHGGKWPWVAGFHTDRPHPHLHIVVSRMSNEGRWLKISRRDAFMNYDNMRAVMVDTALAKGIDLEATTREARGLVDPPITEAEWRRRARAAVEMFPEPEANAPLEEHDPILRAHPGAAETAARIQAAGHVVHAALMRRRARDAGAAAAARARENEERRRHEHEEMDGHGLADQDEEIAGGADGAHARRRRRRRRYQRGTNVETRAQRAVREAQQAARRRDEEHRSAPNVETRARAARRWQEEEAQRRRDERAAAQPNVETRSRAAARRQREEAEDQAAANSVRQPERQAGRSDRPAQQGTGRTGASARHNRNNRSARSRRTGDDRDR